MKLGLAEKHAPRPPAILVLGEGALAAQIQNDLIELGLNTVLLQDLPLAAEDRVLPKLNDLDANIRFQIIFRAFRALEKHQTENAWIHPGVTVWSERPEFEGWARQANMVSISSPSKSLQLFWNTLQLLKAAESIGLPTLVLSDDPVTSIREIEASIKKLFLENKASLPFVLKSAYRVRGGYAQRVIRSLEELHEWVPIWMSLIQEKSGATLLFIERNLESARCYVQPFARLKTGEVELFPVIDGSLMFEGKNWVEVCPAQNVDDEIQNKIENYSKRILEHTGFVGVGNLVFLTNGVEVYLIEGLARLNFGYNLWEKVARTKAIQWQLHALAPGLIVDSPTPRAKLPAAPELCGLNLKLYAEDTWLKIPHPGTVHELSQKTEWAEGDHEGSLIWDVVPGQNIDWKASGALGQITLFSTSWSETLKFARTILKQVWVSGGIQTNERFLYELLSHAWVEESMFYNGFVDEEFIPKQVPDQQWLERIAAVLAEITPSLGEKESWLWMNHRLPFQFEPLEWNQRVEFIANGSKGVKGFFKNEHGNPERICVYPLTPQRFVVRLQNWFFSVRRSEKGRPLQLMALTSGRVHSIFFREGAKVEPKQCVLIIESHQNLITHRLPIPVTVKKLKVKAEDEVLIGEELAELERWSDT
jgi:pyruvate carboxylase